MISIVTSAWFGVLVSTIPLGNGVISIVLYRRTKLIARLRVAGADHVLIWLADAVGLGQLELRPACVRRHS